MKISELTLKSSDHEPARCSKVSTGGGSMRRAEPASGSGGLIRDQVNQPGYRCRGLSANMV